MSGKEAQAKKPRKERTERFWGKQFFEKDLTRMVAVCKLCLQQGITVEFKLNSTKKFEQSHRAGEHLGKEHGVMRDEVEAHATNLVAQTQPVTVPVGPSGQPMYVVVKPDQDKRLTMPGGVSSPSSIPMSRAQEAYQTRLLVVALCLELKPFSMFKVRPGLAGSAATPQWGLAQWIKHLQPAYSLPSRDTLFRVLCDQYEHDKRHLISLLKNFKYLSLVSDAWTSDAKINYRTVLLMGVHSETWQWGCFCLGTRKLSSHVAEDVALFYEKMLAEFEVSRLRIARAVGDGAERAGMEAAKFKYNWCAAHVLHLVLEHAFQRAGLENDVKTCKDVVHHFRASPKQWDSLKELAILAEEQFVALKQQGDTRWGSMLEMMKSLVKNKKILKQYYAEMDKICEIDDGLFSCMEDFIALLEPVRVLMMRLQEYKQSTLVELLPGIFQLRGIWADLVKSKKVSTVDGKKLAECLDQVLVEYLKTSKIWSDEFVSLTFAVSPGGFNFAESFLKCGHFEEDQVVHFPGTKTVAQFRKLMENSLTKFVSLLNKDFEMQERAPSTSVYRDWRELKSTGIPPRQRTEAEEIKDWMRTSLSYDEVSSMQEYWSVSKRLQFPRIAEVAQFVASQVLTAVPAESVFSYTGILSAGRRNRIGQKRLDMQSFEHFNRRFGLFTADMSPSFVLPESGRSNAEK